MASKVQRLFTGIAGLPVHKEPQKELVKLYNRTIRELKNIPETSQYRIATEQLIKERKKIVEENPNPEDIEKKIGAGLCEELIEQAKQELVLTATMQKYKPWEPIEEKPSPDQWKWPPS